MVIVRTPHCPKHPGAYLVWSCTVCAGKVYTQRKARALEKARRESLRVRRERKALAEAQARLEARRKAKTARIDELWP